MRSFCPDRLVLHFVFALGCGTCTTNEVGWTTKGELKLGGDVQQLLHFVEVVASKPLVVVWNVFLEHQDVRLESRLVLDLIRLAGVHPLPEQSWLVSLGVMSHVKAHDNIIHEFFRDIRLQYCDGLSVGE